MWYPVTAKDRAGNPRGLHIGGTYKPHGEFVKLTDPDFIDSLQKRSLIGKGVESPARPLPGRAKPSMAAIASGMGKSANTRDVTEELMGQKSTPADLPTGLTPQDPGEESDPDGMGEGVSESGQKEPPKTVTTGGRKTKPKE